MSSKSPNSNHMFQNKKKEPIIEWYCGYKCLEQYKGWKIVDVDISFEGYRILTVINEETGQKAELWIDYPPY